MTSKPIQIGRIRWADENPHEIPPRPEVAPGFGVIGSAESLWTTYNIVFICTNNMLLRMNATVEARNRNDLIVRFGTLHNCKYHPSQNHGMELDLDSIHS